MSEATVTRWQSTDTPTRDAIEALFRQDGLSASWWSNGAGYRYSAHSHSYHKVLYWRAVAYGLCWKARERPLTWAPATVSTCRRPHCTQRS